MQLENILNKNSCPTKKGNEKTEALKTIHVYKTLKMFNLNKH